MCTQPVGKPKRSTVEGCARPGVSKPLPGQKSAHQDIFKCPWNFLKIKFVLKNLEFCNNRLKS